MADPLDTLEAQGQADRVARKVKRKVDKQSPASRRGRLNKRAGSQAERDVAKMLGPSWKRVPLSGALGGRLRGDVRYEGGSAFRVINRLEVKKRKGGMRQLRRWMEQGQVDGLVIVPADGTPPVVVLAIPRFRLLLERAGQE